MEDRSGRSAILFNRNSRIREERVWSLSLLFLAYLHKESLTKLKTRLPLTQTAHYYIFFSLRGTSTEVFLQECACFLKSL